MKEQELRQNFNLLLLQNPDYFGNLSAVGQVLPGFEPQIQKVSDTFYEELICVSFNPETNELRGVVKVKQMNGYSGGSCTEGSKEYVRFYVDYNRDGSWVDEGVVNFDAHDLSFDEDLCYAVKLTIQPKKLSCCDRTPILPRVRAILSWNNEPPANQPNWPPVWGNRLEANIQIQPRSPFLCTLFNESLVKVGVQLDPDKLDDLAIALEMKEKPFTLPTADLMLLKQVYAGQVEDERFGYSSMLAISNNLFPNKSLQLDAIKQSALIKEIGINIPKLIDFIQIPNFNTAYEEVRCVGLDRDLSYLHGDIVIKRPFGYLGNLCEAGSRQYLAFYMDFGTGWEYMGTTSVRVHDIADIPDDGLYYHAALPVSLTKYQQAWCKAGKAKVRAILSWNSPPPPNQPDYVAPWGDREECTVEIKPLPPGIPSGKVVSVIESLGGMPVSKINASGYANGTNATGLNAIDSPFDGNILVTGIITNPPDSSELGIAKLRYRLMVKQPAQASFQPWLGEFAIDVTTINGGIPNPQVPITQTPDAQGWVDYYPDFVSPNIVSVDRNLLGVYVPAKEGLHELYVEVEVNPTTTIQSSVVPFVVDKTVVKVDVEITSGTGNCGGFKKGEVISGTFSISDAHCLSMSLAVTPAGEASGAAPIIMGVGSSQLDYGAAIAALPGIGTSGTWKLDTSAMKVCGYNIRIVGSERTIINSSYIGRSDDDIEGFCLTL
jgi:hypothetical protein